MMKRSQLIDYLADQIVRIKLPHPVRVALDGVDGAGKTFLAQELVTPLQAAGRPVIRASIDGFHNPAHIRHRRGDNSPEGYYYDSFNYRALTKSLLAPLGAGGSRQYVSAVFDYRTDSKLELPKQMAEVSAILLFDGVFLLRSELAYYWDLTIFVAADFETILPRVEKRDATMFGGAQQVRRRYEQRYIPGQKLYFDECRPAEWADIIIHNNDLRNPVITKDVSDRAAV